MRRVYPRQKKKAYFEANVYFKGEWIDTVGVWVKENQTSVELTANVESDQADFRVFYWTPGTPNLYDVTFQLFVDQENCGYGRKLFWDEEY